MGAKALIISLLLPAFAAMPAAGADELPVVAAFGDSLSSGYSLAADEGFAPVLARELRALGAPATVLNAAVAGDTSTDGLARVDWMLRKKPDLVIVELGANDMLRGLPPALLYNNLHKIVGKIKQSGAKVLLAGMRASPNLGPKYAGEFAAVYRRIADEHDVALFPFFLRDVAARPSLNLPDGVHPNAAGVRVIAGNIAPLAAELLRD